MKMKRVFLYLGMGSCVSSPTKSAVEPPPSNKFSDDHDHDHHTLEKMLNSVQSPVWEPQGSKEEAFFDSKPCFDSDDESDFFSVNGDFPPYKLTTDNNGVHQGRKLLDLFKESSSFSSDSQRSVIAAKVGKENEDYHIPTTPLTPSYNNINNNKLEKGKSGKSVKHHCLPSLVRSLSSCGERKKRQSPAHMAVVTG